MLSRLVDNATFAALQYVACPRILGHAHQAVVIGGTCLGYDYILPTFLKAMLQQTDRQWACYIVLQQTLSMLQQTVSEHAT